MLPNLANVSCNDSVCVYPQYAVFIGQDLCEKHPCQAAVAHVALQSTPLPVLLAPVKVASLKVYQDRARDALRGSGDICIEFLKSKPGMPERGTAHALEPIVWQDTLQKASMAQGEVGALTSKLKWAPPIMFSLEVGTCEGPLIDCR